MTDKEYMTFAVDTAKLDERIVTGIAAPYGEVTVKGGRKLRFERGLFGDVQDAFLYFNHDESLAPIGKVFAIEDTDEGLAIQARISKTPRGDEIYELLKDGVLDRFSVGAIAHSVRQDEDVTVWTAAELTEISVVPKPAFKNAAVAQVHSADTTHTKEVVSKNMTNVENSEVVELTGRLNDLERKFALVDRAETPVVSKFNSGGEFLKALAAGDEAARNEFKFAYTGATSADADITRPAWVNSTLEIVRENRDILNLFKKAALPAQGNSIEYARVSAVSGTVGVQAAEGDDLNYLEVAIDTATAPVKTYGGYSSLSFQAIQRSDVAYLQTVLDFQAQQYAKATNSAVRSAVAAATGTSAVTALTADSGQAWLKLVLAARRAIKAANSQAGVVIVSADVYDRLFTLVDSAGRPVFDLNGDGTNTFGNANMVSGTIAGLPVVIDDAAPEDTCWILGADAVTVFEQPGAPLRLQDENVINLTKDFSLYGYMAIAVNKPAAIVRADVDLAA